MARTVDEWIGKSDDAKVPDRVRQRVFERENGVCHLTGRKIQPGEPWDLDHRKALILGGEHRESNLFPALKEPHRKKTAVEVGIKAKIAKIKQKHLGIKKSKKSMTNPRWKKRFDGVVVDRETGEPING